MISARFAQVLHTELATAKTRDAERRARVLAHEELRQALTEPPLNYAQPGQWTGYIPPRLLADHQINPSPVRIALIAICERAMELENTPDAEPMGS